MGNHLERVFPSWLGAGFLSDGESNRRGRQRRRRRFEAVLLRLEDRQLLSSFPVTSTADNGGTGTLRWAVAGANADTTPSTIVFELGTAAATITLTQGQLELSNTSESVTIYDGTAEGPVTISGNNQSGVFQVNSGVTASISGLTIADGATRVGAGDPGDGSINDLGTLNLSDCTISNNDTGNGVYVNGTADITDCTVTGGNSSYGAGVFVFDGTADITGCTIDDNTGPGNIQGAGVANSGTTTLVNCTISGNSGGGSGGAIYNFSTHYAPALLMMYSCTVSGNTSSNEGAGLANDGIAYLTGCTISGNSNDNLGGGVWNRNGATLDLSDCTISANNASVGGGLYNSGTATLVACTLSGNTTYNSGAGIYAGGTLTLNNTIVAGNDSAPYDSGIVSPSDIVGTSVSGSNDLVGTGGSADLSSSTNLLGITDPDLGSLADNGGPTETIALLRGSPAIGAGSAVLEVNPGGAPLTADQRGEPLDFPNPDIGAYQTQRLISLSFSGLTSPGIAYGTANVTIAGTLSNGDHAPPDTENVEITLDGATQSAAFGSSGAFTTTFDTSALPASATPYAVMYNYAGDSEFAAAITTSTVTVSQATPTLSVGDAGGTYNGSAIAASATISGVGGSAGSSLEGVPLTDNYYAGTTATGTPLSGVPINAGTYTVVASFAGSSDFVASTSHPVIFTISRATPAVSVAEAGGIYNGSAFAATATITGVNGLPAFSLDGIAPKIAYYAGSNVAGAPLSGAPVDAGPYTVVATYSGSADYSPGQSMPVTFTIARASVTVALTSTVGSPVYGQPVTLVVTVVAAVPTDGMPAGTVTFVDGATALATVPLDSSGSASLVTSVLAVGPQSITVTYSGSTDFFGVGSGSGSEPPTAAGNQLSASLPVARAGTSVVLVTSPLFKKRKLVSVGLTAAVMPIAPGGGVPTGAVTFEMFVKGKGKKAKTREQVLGTATLAGGRATWEVKTDQVLKKSITIAYAGDADFASSTATPPALNRQVLENLALPMLVLDHRDGASR